MPIYKGSTEVTSGNLYKGSTKIENGYKGSDSFYVNELAITALSFSSGSIGSSGGNTNFVVTGANNATYTLNGTGGATAPGGTHTVSGSSDTQVISIGGNTGNCAPSRTPVVTVTPTGASVFSPSNLPNNDSISQAASPNCVPAVTISGTFTVAALTGGSGTANVSSNTPCNWTDTSGGSASNTSSYSWSLAASSTCGATTTGTVYATPISSSYTGNSAGISAVATNTYGPFSQTGVPTNFSLTNTGSWPNPNVKYINACTPPAACTETGVTWFGDTTGAPGSGNVTIEYVLSKSGCTSVTKTRTVSRSTNTQLNLDCFLGGTVTMTLI